MGCPHAEDISAFISRRAMHSEAIEAHLESCPSCRDLVLELARERRASSASPPDPDEPMPGTSIGRYLVSRPLGAGGMGLVFVAWDPQLERDVAIKLVRPSPGADIGDLHARLVREAKAMARLSHPNVVAVHEVGTFGDQVFVVMEYVDGATLRSWMNEPRSWKQTVHAFAAAGDGLAAAHQAGLVHRDFKPDNVLVARDGRICVTDFGLARPIGASATVAPANAAATDAPQSVLAGTVAYMAPELFEGQPCDERSDLYSFCVALFEALCGARPVADREQHARQLAAAGRIPGWLSAVVRRGLSADPAARPASMRELVGALRSDPAQARRSRAMAGAVVVLVGAAFGLGARAVRKAEIRCEGGPAQLLGVWDAPRRHQVVAVLGSTLGGHVAVRLDRYADDWLAAHRDNCQASVRGEQSDALRDARTECLDDLRRDLTAVATQLTLVDAEHAVHAADAVGGLPLVSECAAADASRRTARLPSDPTQRARVMGLRSRVADAQAQLRLAKLSAALSAAERIVADGAGQDPDSEGKAELVRASALHRLERDDDARRAYRRASVLALRASNAATVAQSWVGLADLAGYAQRNTDDALAWLDMAGALTSTSPAAQRVELSRLVEISAVLQSADRWDEATRVGRQAVALAERTRSAGDTEVAAGFTMLAGGLARRQDTIDEAVRLGERSIAEVEAAGLGETTTHAMMLYNHALTLCSAGRYEDCILLVRHALAINQRELPAMHESIIGNLLTLGFACAWLGRWRDARDALAPIVPVIERHREQMPHQVAEAWMYAAMAEEGLGQPRRAEALYRRALADRDLSDDADKATAEIGLARLLARRDPRRALALARDAHGYAVGDLLPNRTLVRQIDDWLATHQR